MKVYAAGGHGLEHNSMPGFLQDISFLKICRPLIRLRMDNEKIKILKFKY